MNINMNINIYIYKYKYKYNYPFQIEEIQHKHNTSVLSVQEWNQRILSVPVDKKKPKWTVIYILY